MRRVSIKAKIISVVIISSVAVVVVLMAILWQQSVKQRNQLQQGLIDLARNETSKIAKDVYLMCQMTDEQVKLQVEHGLAVGDSLLKAGGGITLAPEQAQWSAKNQFSDQQTTVSLPKLLLKDQWLGQYTAPSEKVPLVDDITKLMGGTATVFQRMNKQGDMLRVATNVITADGKRAIGTYIPATDPDGTANPVVSAVLGGKTYNGRAFVVDSWYITAYEPLKDAQGQITGMLYFGIKQENIESLRKGIIDIVVGSTGYVFVLGGTGDQQGQYIISAQGKKDGENIWEAKDAKGNFFIQSLIGKALATKDGATDFQEYDWEHPETKKVETKISAVTYFEPWDWVIGSGMYYSDYNDTVKQSNVMLVAAPISLVLLIIMSIVALFVANTMANPIIAATSLAQTVAEGDLTKSLSITTNDEINDLVGSLNTMSGRLRGIVLSLNDAAGNLSASSQELAAATDETGRSVQRVANKVVEVAHASQKTERTIQESQESLNQTAMAIQGVSSDIEEVAGYAATAVDKGTSGKHAADQAAQIIQQAAASVQETTGLVESLGTKTQQIAQFIGIITGIADQTNLLALNAAIEAARAGEAGRGFAVVAEEVRKLAEESSKAAGSITTVVKSIEGEMESALTAMRRSDEEVKHGATAVLNASQLLGEIVGGVNSLSERVQNISAAAEEVSASTSEVVGSMHQITSLVQSNSSATQEVSSATQEQTAQTEEIGANASNIARLAIELHELVSHFKI
jgi:methyl-accepting chemotaxis protein